MAAAALPATPADAQGSDMLATLDRLLGAHVRPGRDGLNRVAYAAWARSAADRAALDACIADMARTGPSRLSRPDAFAFWSNLYNAVTLQVVLGDWPVRSIREIRPSPVSLGPWGVRRVTVDGRALSLDDIEHRILRRDWSDPRVHYAVNCASIGCPNLQPRAWRGATLDRDLDAAARAYVNHPRGVRPDGDGRVAVSSIYRWFRADFGGNDAGILAHLRLHAAAPLAARLQGVRISRDFYDWSINAAEA